jgi:hypothetical protein
VLILWDNSDTNYIIFGKLFLFLEVSLSFNFEFIYCLTSKHNWYWIWYIFRISINKMLMYLTMTFVLMKNIYNTYNVCVIYKVKFHIRNCDENKQKFWAVMRFKLFTPYLYFRLKLSFEQLYWLQLVITSH